MRHVVGMRHVGPRVPSVRLPHAAGRMKDALTLPCLVCHAKELSTGMSKGNILSKVLAAAGQIT